MFSPRLLLTVCRFQTKVSSVAFVTPELFFFIFVFLLFILKKRKRESRVCRLL